MGQGIQNTSSRGNLRHAIGMHQNPWRPGTLLRVIACLGLPPATMEREREGHRTGACVPGLRKDCSLGEGYYLEGQGLSLSSHLAE